MDVFWLIFLIVVGACVGSFLNVLIYRLPRRQSIVFPGSRCPACGRGIKWYDNIPIVSWIALGGKCRWCQAPISPSYLVIEAVTAALVAGLYVCYFMLDTRKGAGDFSHGWVMFSAHAALLCGLLVGLMVDLKHWIVPLEVMWVCSILGIAGATFRPHPFMASVGADTIGLSVGAGVGLIAGLLLVRWGFIQQSFLDADDTPPPPSETDHDNTQSIHSVAITSAHGVNPRKEVLRELLFLAPAVVLGAGVVLLLRIVPGAGTAWGSLFDQQVHPRLAPHLTGAGSALFGYLIGGFWIWGMRILGTLIFGKEAMGLGDAHLMGAVGAVTGWIVPSLVFFIAPFIGLTWGLYLWGTRSQRELPYGPWLGTAALITMVFYDQIMKIVGRYAEIVQALSGSGVGK